MAIFVARHTRQHRHTLPHIPVVGKALHKGHVMLMALDMYAFLSVQGNNETISHSIRTHTHTRARIEKERERARERESERRRQRRIRTHRIATCARYIAKKRVDLPAPDVNRFTS